MAALEGRCLCGGVRFEVAEPFTVVTACHCTSCKKLSGSWGTVNGRARSEWVQVVAGEELVRTYQPEEGSAKTFCADCGSNLFGGGWPEAEECSVRISALETPWEHGPERHIYVRSVAPWETIPDDGAPRYDVRP